MKEYDFTQWLLLFYMFSFFGWIFESSYVSIINKKLVNRGFLIGPWIPIYGFGGVLMLFVALPFYFDPVLVFIVGLVAASTLEYFTGVIMERIFAVKYWDYTGKPFASKNGYICLESSLCWGVFTLILTYVGDRWIEGFIYTPSKAMFLVLDSVLTLVFLSDVYVSAKTALHIKDMAQLVSKANAEMNEIMSRMPENVTALRDAFDAAREDGHITREEWNDLVGKALSVLSEDLSEKRAQAIKHFESVLAKRQTKLKDLDALTKRMLASNPSASSRLEGFDMIRRRVEDELKKKDQK